jgi:hypothetical protein
MFLAPLMSACFTSATPPASWWSGIAALTLLSATRMNASAPPLTAISTAPSASVIRAQTGDLRRLSRDWY